MDLTAKRSLKFQRMRYAGLALFLFGIACLAVNTIVDISLRQQTNEVAKKILSVASRVGDLKGSQPSENQATALHTEAQELSDILSLIQSKRESPLSIASVSWMVYVLSTISGLMLMIYATSQYAASRPRNRQS